MKLKTISTWRSPAVALLAAAFSSAVIAGAEFSADTVQHGPKGEMSTGRMFVGDKRVRTEMSHQGQQIIRVTDESRGVEWILFPEQKKYMEQKLAGPPGNARDAKAAMAGNPCGDMPGLTCNNLGEEDLGGRVAVKWEMTATQQGQTMKSTRWFDKERGFPLRQEMPNGQTMELKFVAAEDLGGRQVEKWEMVATIPDQPEKRAFQWFDPELDEWVRQELPGGMSSELTNIRVGKQPDELFNVPAGFERISAPPGMPADPSKGGDAQR